MFSLLSVNVVYIALSAAKLVFFGHGIDNIVTLASAVHSHLARIRRQNRQRPQPCTWRLDNTRHCLSCISVSVIGAFSQLELDTNSGSIKEREFPTVNSYLSKIYIADSCADRETYGSSRRTWNLERNFFECCIINVTFSSHNLLILIRSMFSV